MKSSESNAALTEAADPRIEVAGIVERARTAQQAIDHYTQEQVDALVLAVGGGTFALLDHQVVPAAQTSATVRDLQSYDGNAQLFQQLSSLDGDEDNASGASN